MLQSYDKTIKLINKWMVNSGVREFCSKECRGKCCQGLRGTYCKLHKDCNNIQCAVFLCSNIRMLLPEHLSDKQRKAMYYIFDKTFKKTTHNGFVYAFSKDYFQKHREKFFAKTQFDTKKLGFYMTNLEIDFKKIIF